MCWVTTSGGEVKGSDTAKTNRGSAFDIDCFEPKSLVAAADVKINNREVIICWLLFIDLTSEINGKRRELKSGVVTSNEGSASERKCARSNTTPPSHDKESQLRLPKLMSFCEPMD